jgi:hypothetical protein
MVLKRVGTAPERELSRQLDEYVPFHVELAPEVGSIDEILYWRGGDSRHLLEIKIVRTTGMIGGVKLILVPKESRRIVGSVRAVGLPTTTGIPVVDLARWRSKLGNRELTDPRHHLVAENAAFVFAIGADGIAVRFNSGESASTVRNGDLTFSFTEQDALCGITLTGLAALELRRMRKRHGP